MASWDEFLVAQIGASAALAGLLFVGLSINLSKVVKQRVLPDLALQALALLITILVVASLATVPGTGGFLLGIEMLVVAVTAGWLLTTLSLRVVRRSDAQYRAGHIIEAVLIGTIPALYAASGILLVLGGPGLYLLVPAFLVSYLVSVVLTWVLLVEINR